VNILLTEEHHHSEPMNKLLDIPKLFTKIVPLLPRIRANKYDISLPLANELRKIIKSCTRPGVKHFDLVGRIVAKNGAEAMANLVKNMQFIIVHNNMDMGSVDILRRCSCAIVQPEIHTAEKVVSSCTGCI
jgi:hypothetical protein